jgi:hypothetical protein
MLVDISIHINPIYHQEPPRIKVMVDDDIIHHGDVIGNTIFNYSGNMKNDNHKLSITLLNKTDLDCVDGKDKAIIIDKVTFFGIDSNKVLNHSSYVPLYSEAYLKSMINLNKSLDTELIGCNYLGWNGEWVMIFEVPVFKWLHKIEDLGWVYSEN